MVVHSTTPTGHETAYSHTTARVAHAPQARSLSHTTAPVMSVKVLLNDYPNRSIALVTDSHALIFRYSPPGSENGPAVHGVSNLGSAKGGGSPRIMVEFSSNSAADLQEYRPISHPCKGTLGLISIGDDVFICLVTGSSHVATVRPGERVERIHSVQFHCLNRSDYDRMLELEVNSYTPSGLDDDGLDYGARPHTLEHPCLALKKLLGGGTFYYSTDFDLTNRLQNRSIDTSAFDIDNFDPGFLWNSYMISPLIKFRSYLSNSERRALDESHLLTSAIQGFVETLTIPHSSSFSSSKKSGIPATLTLISRLSCKKAGTRFNARGIDDEGNVANFVETETVVWDPTGASSGGPLCFSYCQIRGSVPLFWEQQTGLLPNQQKITLTRSPEATQPAFDKHFEALTLKYGVAHVVNLLSATKPGEVELSKRFRYHIRNSPLNNDAGQLEQNYNGQIVKGVSGSGEGTLIRSTEYDFHAETQGRYENANAIRHILMQSADAFAYFLIEDLSPSRSPTRSPQRNDEPMVVLQQEGIFRTNCLDCLDRTNLVQGILSQLAIESFLHHRGDTVSPDFWMRHSTLWADNGDSLSKIYAGTGALKSSYTRHGKSGWAGLISDARKSATRMYINKFVDGSRQETIDMLLGRLMGQSPVSLYDPINDYTQAELARRASEYSSSESIYIYIGTFNVNGKTNGINDDLSSWLCPAFVEAPQQQPEIVVVGFQEIVELSPQQIMSTDPAVRKLWEKAVLRCLNQNAERIGGDEYIMLRGGQLVGAALMIFVKSSAIENIKNVEGSVKKTGMSGVAGNKGAVAIRMDYASTRLCFVTAHLAAGFSNYDERNRDYRVISHGLRFQRGRSINSHDTIIWLGDFNYRIGLQDDTVRKLIQMREFHTLYENDQLNLQMVAGLTFPFYSEAEINFDPTYKFDLGRDVYDTSEKARIPAWCDRVLWKGSNLKQISYNSAPLRFSDHRPVYATFKCQVWHIDEAKKEKLSREIYFKRRSEMGGRGRPTTLIDVGDHDDQNGGDDNLLWDDEPVNVIPGLPPPSSDKQKWWLNNGHLASSDVQPPGDGYIYNPNKPPNPFTPTNEPDWVKVDLTGSSSYSTISNGAAAGVGGGAKNMIAPTPPPARASSIASTLTANTPAGGASRRKLPPPFDPNNLPLLPSRSNTFKDSTKNGGGGISTPPQQTSHKSTSSTSGRIGFPQPSPSTTRNNSNEKRTQNPPLPPPSRVPGTITPMKLATPSQASSPPQPTSARPSLVDFSTFHQIPPITQQPQQPQQQQQEQLQQLQSSPSAALLLDLQQDLTGNTKKSHPPVPAKKPELLTKRNLPPAISPRGMEIITNKLTKSPPPSHASTPIIPFPPLIPTSNATTPPPLPPHKPASSSAGSSEPNKLTKARPSPGPPLPPPHNHNYNNSNNNNNNTTPNSEMAQVQQGTSLLRRNTELPDYVQSLKEKPALPVRNSPALAEGEGEKEREGGLGLSRPELGVESKSQITDVRRGVAQWEGVGGAGAGGDR